MSNLLNCQLLTKSFGAHTLFQNINFTVNSGDKVGVIGPNGSGKSTLLKIICELEDSDSGTILRQKHMQVSYLAQDDVFVDELSIFENLERSMEGSVMEEMEKYNRIHSILSRAEFEDSSINVGLLSGGWRKRLAICRALVSGPDLLVMDEPTNHLDIEGILWLEKMFSGGLVDGPASYIMVSHDRQFLESCTNRIVELSAVYPEGALQVKGNYSQFLEEREKYLALQSEQEVRLSNKVRRETEWLRRGPKARATKAQYRIDEAHRLTDELGDVRGRNRAISSVKISFDSTGRKTKKLLETKEISKAYDSRQLFSDVSMVLSPGTRLGLLGRNGCGKSTLMTLLAASVHDQGERPDSGSILTADGLQLVLFDQRREQLDQSLTLRRALAPDGDSVVFQGRSLHVVSWAKRFLFEPDQLETPVAQLSGGEQARILIAQLVRQPADILLLDEPTNDLDINSLDVLEQSLTEFPGALILVSHDRYLLDRVCDVVLGFDGKGGTAFYSDYLQWLADLKDSEEPKDEQVEKKKESSKQPKRKPGKLSYMDQREYDSIEDRILEGEARKEELQQKMDEPATVANPGKLDEYWQEMQEVEQEVDQLYARWDELEVKMQGG